MIIAFCVFRCVASKREDVHAAIKAHKLQQNENDDTLGASQFVPGDDGKSLYANAVYLSRKSARKQKMKGVQDEVVRPDSPGDQSDTSSPSKIEMSSGKVQRLSNSAKSD